jgi:zinc transport system substrate-binding protein
MVTLSPLFSEKPTVLVSIAPYKFFVEKIGKDTVNTLLFVPPGASPHTYEPTAKKVMEFANADLWFQMGEPFERQAERGLIANKPNLKIVDLREGIPLICSGPGVCSHNSGDPHVWLSPKLAKIQSQIIAKHLIDLVPNQKEMIQNNLKNLLSELDQLDKEIQSTMQGVKKKTFLVSHPAYAYFAKDYGLTQLNIEQEGREPSPKKVYEIVQEAKAKGIRTVFAQTQHSIKGAERIAAELGGKVVLLDPLSENYIENLRQIASKVASQQ